MFLELPYLEGIESQMSVAKPLINHSNTHPSTGATDTQCIHYIHSKHDQYWQTAYPKFMVAKLHKKWSRDISFFYLRKFLRLFSRNKSKFLEILELRIFYIPAKSVILHMLADSRNPVPGIVEEFDWSNIFNVNCQGQRMAF